MNFENPTQSESRLTQEERANISDLVASFRQHFVEQGIPKNPFLTLRLRGFLQQVILCDRLETALLTGAKELTPEAAAHLGRAYDRFNRALKSLEDTVKKLTPSAEPRPKSADAASRTAKNPPDPAESPEPSSPVNDAPDTTPTNHTQSAPPPAPSISPIPPVTPPPSPIPPAQSPRPTPQPVIHVPRPVPLVPQHQRR